MLGKYLTAFAIGFTLGAIRAHINILLGEAIEDSFYSLNLIEEELI